MGETVSEARAVLEAILLLREPIAELANHLLGKAPEPGWLASLPYPLRSEIALARIKARGG